MNELPERIPLHDAHLAHLAHANSRWEDVPERLAQDWQILSKLIYYYESDWRHDVENHPDAQFGVLSEDGVWNEMGRFYEAVKEIAATAARIVAQYESGKSGVDAGE